MSEIPIDTLTRRVQHNCDIADARHGANYSMCVYLMKMREYFRWEKGYGFNATLPKDEVGPWLAEREQRWAELDEDDYQRLPVGDIEVAPFDAETINAALFSQGLVYSAGLGMQAAEHFFLAELDHHETHGDFTIHVAGRELARDLTSPPAMSQGRNIFLRREAFRRLLWERVETWRWNRADNAMGRAIAAYPFETDVDAALDAMTEAELNAALQHEIGEIRAGECLGNDAWRAMLMAISHTPAELIARSVRDHLADALVTLPALLETGNAPSIHFYVGNLTNMRKHLFPSLVSAYEAWRESNDDKALRILVDRAQGHWLDLAVTLLTLYREHGPDAGILVAAAESRRL
ncbi:MAG: hypothetical protein H6981_01810 [Gammaproteobacteria bacterium]|nr:hypothetical protein [Gammaproteobacteria bacterium]MCP5135524.1 hypothetical protein [Gammaproteobacteria bacterium]